MVTFKKRFPPAQDLFIGFSACALPVFIWSIYNVLKEVPAWVMRLGIWDLIGAIAYTQAFALVESTLLFLVLLGLAVALPPAIFRDHFQPLSTIILIITTLWFILAHQNDQIVRTWGIRQFAIWGLIALGTVGVAFWLVHRVSRFRTAIQAVMQRLSVLGAVYLLVGVVSLIIIVIRNI